LEIKIPKMALQKKF